MRRAAFHTLGCKVNAYETDVMKQRLREAGYEIVPFTETADVYIVNTCTVTNIADRKSRQMLHKARKMNPDALIVAAGCYAQVAADSLSREEEIDLLVGNNRKNELPALIEAAYRDRGRRFVDDLSKPCGYEDMSLETVTEHTRAYLKVQDGCNQFCSYCIIPYARGRVRSRRQEDVRAEVIRLAENGVREIVLTGIHLSSYGMESGYRENLLSLIETVHAVPGVLRIRLGSLEPRIVTEEFAEKLAGMEKVCRHFHLSLQSGCDETLKRMNRHYTSGQYYEKSLILRKYMEDCAITTDVIVGFPGETAEEFACSEEFLKKVGFYEMHIFKYSMRKGTAAAAMDNQVSEEEKNRRSARLIRLGEEMSDEFRRRRIGTQTELLLEKTAEMNGRKMTVGYTKEYIRGAVEGEWPANKGVRGKAVGFCGPEILCLEDLSF